MTAAGFVDTNILLYAISSAPAEAEKTQRARALLRRDDLGLSTQVLQEFYVNATHKMKRPIAHRDAWDFIEVWSEFAVLPVTPDVIRTALSVRERFELAYWDAAIVAAAQHLRAGVLFSEDFQHGQRFGQVEVCNPFL